MLCALLVLPAQSAQQTSSPTVQEQVGKISTGSIVEAKTKLKNMKTVRGRLGAVTADGFEIQTANGQKVDTVKLSFADVKSVAAKPQSKTHTWVYIAVGAGIAFGVLLVVSLILVAYNH
jgi:hypothetical protein